MPGYVLDGAGRVELPRRTVAVTVDAVGSSVQVRALTDEGIEPASVVHPRAGFMVLPRIDVPTVVAARPGNGSVFAEGTVLHVVIGEDTAHEPDPERAELTPIDVSGLHQVELATITPAGDRLEIAARKTVVDAPLGDLAARSRSAARGCMRIDRLPVKRQVAVELDIDTTYSMLPRIEDGSVRSIVDVVAGITAVVGAEQSVRVNLIGRTPKALPPYELRDVAHTVQQVLDTVPLGVGFRAASGGLPSPTVPTLVVTVTDSVPVAGSVTRDSSEHHVVVLGPADSTHQATNVGVTRISAAAALLDRPTELSRLVGAILAPFAAYQDLEGVVE